MNRAGSDAWARAAGTGTVGRPGRDIRARAPWLSFQVKCRAPARTPGVASGRARRRRASRRLRAARWRTIAAGCGLTICVGGRPGARFAAAQGRMAISNRMYLVPYHNFRITICAGRPGTRFAPAQGRTAGSRRPVGGRVWVRRCCSDRPTLRVCVGGGGGVGPGHDSPRPRGSRRDACVRSRGPRSGARACSLSGCLAADTPESGPGYTSCFGSGDDRVARLRQRARALFQVRRRRRLGPFHAWQRRGGRDRAAYL